MLSAIGSATSDSVLEQTPYAMLIHALDGTVLQANRAWELLFGVSRTELKGYSLLQDQVLIDAGLMPLVKRAFEGEAVTLPPLYYQPSQIQRSGRDRWIRSRLVPIRSELGDVVEVISLSEDITAQKMAEDAAQATAANLRLIANTIPQIVFTLDADGKTDYLNDRWYEYTGMNPTTAVETATEHALHPDDLETCRTLLRQALELRMPMDHELRLRGGDGRYRWFLCRVQPVREPNGEVRRWVGTSTDIHRQKMAEKGLRESRDKLDIILHSVNEGISLIDEQGRVLFANGTAAFLTGYLSAQELMDNPLETMLDELAIQDESGGSFPREMLPHFRVLRGERSPPEVLVQINSKRSHARRWVLMNAKPLLDEEGRVICSVNIFKDFTERKRVQDGYRFLADAGRVLGSSLDPQVTIASIARLAVPTFADWCTVHLLNSEGQIEQIEAAHVQPEKVALAKEFYEKFPPRWDSEDGVAATIRTGRSRFVPRISDEMIERAAQSAEHLRIIRSVGLRSYISVPIRHNGRSFGALSLVMAESERAFEEQDLWLAESLGDRAAVALENARLYGEAQRVNRIKDEFLATLSHELRTPMNVIQGYAELLREPDINDAERAESVDAIYRNAMSQTQIINDLLDVSSIITGQFAFHVQSVDPNQCVHAAVESVDLAARNKNIRIAVDGSKAPGRIEADPFRLQQVLWNLLSNAVKFTGAGGRIDVTVDQEGPMCRFTVQDTGIGIDAEFLPFVFERFRQADSTTTRRFGGLGLGLSIVKHLVELHGGTVLVSSQGKGEGTVFQVLIPIAKS